jgi:hypothetical protein
MVRFNPLLGITPASNMVFAVNGYQQMLVSRNFDIDYFDLLVGKRFYIIGLLIAIKVLVVFYILAQVIAWLRNGRLIWNWSNNFWAFFSHKNKMTKRFLNVQYGTLTAEVNITGMSRLGEVQDAIKAKLGEAIPVAAALIQLYTNSNKDQLITDLDDITPENTPPYYQKLTQGGSCVVIGTSSPPSRQPTQVHPGIDIYNELHPQTAKQGILYNKY